jgi:GTP-binding protein
MEIKTAELRFVVAQGNSKAEFRYPLVNEPQIAFVGRSNVGKSSLINTLTGISKLAWVSNTPGKTQQINYYYINEKFYFVDLPGYGYAQESQSVRNLWKKLIEGFFQNQIKLCLCVQIIDIRHELNRLDQTMIKWLEYNRMNYLLVLNKSDKLSKNDVPQKTKYFKRLFSENKFCKEIILFSSLTKQGKKEVLKSISQFI